MSLRDDFPEEMGHTVTIAPLTGNNGDDDVFGTAVSYSCRIERAIVNIKDRQDKQAVSTAQIYLDGAASVNYGDKVILYGESPPILRIEFLDDEKCRPYSTVIYL